MNNFLNSIIKHEYITCAAIHVNNKKIYKGHHPKNIDSGYVACGLRHGHCFTIMARIYKKEDRVETLRCSIQGFLTSKNRFVDREEAGKIAFESKQIKEKTNCLFSEDLY